MNVAANLEVRCINVSSRKLQITTQGSESWVECICLDWRLKLEQYWLGDENLARFRAQMANFRFQKLDLLARSTTPHLQKPIYDGVKVHIVLIRHFLVPMIWGGSIQWPERNNDPATIRSSPSSLILVTFFSLGSNSTEMLVLQAHQGDKESINGSSQHHACLYAIKCLDIPLDHQCETNLRIRTHKH